MRRNILRGKLMVVLTALLALFTAVGVAEEVRTDASGQWKYVLEDGNAKITGYVVEPSGDLVIPGELDGYPVTGIGERALDYLSLTSVTIPDSVVTITPYSFNYLRTLSRVDVKPDNPAFESIDGVLFDKRQGMLMAYPTTRTGTYAVPEGTRIIGMNAFYGRAKLTGITLPNSVTCIDRFAFGGCYGLSGITIPGSVASIGESAFNGCGLMTNIVLMEGITEIGEWAFLYCRSLTSVTIPSSVASIGMGAFAACDSLTSVTIPRGVTSIGDDAFGVDSSPDLVLTVEEGSYAEQYAKNNGIPYIFVSDADDDSTITIEEITVGTAEELLSALGSNRRILLKEGVYNLTEAEPGFIGNANVSFEECYDGYELVFREVHNLTLQGVGDVQSEIIIEPRYAYVMNFIDCSNISIANIKAGHTDAGYCEGGVFLFESSTGIEIDGTEMYGCGMIGIELYDVTNAKVTSSVIYECTNGIMEIFDSSNIFLTDCVFRDNTGGIMIFVDNTSNLAIDTCSFLRNSDPSAMFAVSESENVIVKNSEFIDNKVKELVDPEDNDIELDASNRFENNAFD